MDSIFTVRPENLLIEFHGDVAAYQALKKMSGELQMAVYLVPGNHDERRNFLRVFPEQFTAIIQRHPQVKEGNQDAESSISEIII